jgi:phosphohistidine phosphatase
MELYFIRHGIAWERGILERDEERPLTDKGREKTTQVARRLVQQQIRFEGIFHSPLVRARQTAEILQAESLGDRLLESDALAPEGDIHQWIAQLTPGGDLALTEESRFALVGHQPDLGRWAETLIWGEAQDKIILKKAGVIAVQIPAIALKEGEGELFLLISPRWLI